MIFRNTRRADDDTRAEMAAHLEMETAENIRRGMAPDEARRQALIASGGLTQAAEHVRRQRGLPWIEGIAADARYAVRHFGRTPLTTVTMVFVLALGLGTTVVLFTLLNSLATMPAPGIARDASLVRIRGMVRTRETTAMRSRPLSWPEVQEFANRRDLFDGVAAYVDEPAAVTFGEGTAMPITARLIFATASYFGTLGIRPVLGTPPGPEPDVMRMSTSPTVMISHAMWQQHFGGASDVVGRTLRVNDVALRVVGVAPPRFAGTEGRGGMAAWVSLAAYPLIAKRSTAIFLGVDSLFLNAAARLRPGISRETAAAAVGALAERVSRAGGRRSGVPATGSDEVRGQDETVNADVVPLLASNDRVSDARRSDMLISGATSGGFALLVLLITCTNVSALMVGLAVARRREIAVRLSLGAPRMRLIRQLLTESVLLSLVAATIGLLVTAMGIRVIGSAFDDLQLAVDWRVTAATCAVALVTGTLFGLSPALHATRIPVGEVLKGASSSVAATRSRLQRGLVVAQIALTQPLLVGLGVVVATMTSDVGSRATSAVSAQVAEIELDTWASRVSVEERASRIGAIVERVGAMPGVLAAVPMQAGTVTVPLTVHRADRVAGIAYRPVMTALFTAAPKGYFTTFSIPIVRGRDFDRAEYAHPPDVVDPTVIDRAIIGTDLARKLWGDADPLGRRLTIGLSRGADTAALVVVGVVDAAAAGPSEVNDQIRVYVPYASVNTGVIVRTAGPALPMLGTIRRIVAAEAPQLPITRAETVQQREAEAHRNLLRASAAVAGGGLLALLLSAIGLYAVVSFSVGQRTREIGIRTALGSQRGQVVRLFFARGFALSAVGLLLGLPLSIGVTRVISDTLNWPLSSSPLLGIAIGAVVLIVASIAVWIPARRASTIDPVVALRIE